MPLPQVSTIWERVLRPRPKSDKSKPRKCKNSVVPSSGIKTPKNVLLETSKTPWEHKIKKRPLRAKAPKKKQTVSKESNVLFEIWKETGECKPRKCKLPIPPSKIERSKTSPSVRRGPKKSNRNIDSKVTSKGSSTENKDIKPKTGPVKKMTNAPILPMPNIASVRSARNSKKSLKRSASPDSGLGTPSTVSEPTQKECSSLSIIPTFSYSNNGSSSPSIIFVEPANTSITSRSEPSTPKRRKDTTMEKDVYFEQENRDTRYMGKTGSKFVRIVQFIGSISVNPNTSFPSPHGGNTVTASSGALRKQMTSSTNVQKQMRSASAVQSVGKASTSTQKTISLVTSPNAVISPKVTSLSINVPKQPESAPAMSDADKSPLLSLAATLSPKRMSTDNGVDNIESTKQEQVLRPKKRVRGSVGSRPVTSSTNVRKQLRSASAVQSVGKASTSAQKTISLVTSTNAVISPKVTSPSINVPKLPESAPAVPGADKSPLLSLAATLSPKRMSTDNGLDTIESTKQEPARGSIGSRPDSAAHFSQPAPRLGHQRYPIYGLSYNDKSPLLSLAAESGVDTIKPTKHEQVPRPKKPVRGSVGSRPAHVAHHRQSAPHPFTEPLTINTNIANARRSSVSRQLLSSHTPSTPATASPRSGHQRYPIYGLADVPHNKPEAPLDFFSRMQERRRLNTLAIGLHGSSKKSEELGKKYTDEYYYREILMRSPPNGSQTPGSEEESIDVTSLEDDRFPNDEVLTSSPAESCAKDVLRTLKSSFPTTSDLDWDSANGEDEDDNPEQDISNTLMEKLSAAQVPREVFEHLQQMLKYIFVQRLTDLSTQNVVAGSSMLYSSSLTNANRLRESLKLFSKQRLASIVVAHIWLLRNLNVPLLAAYLNLLRFLKVAGSSLSQYVVDNCPTQDRYMERANGLIKKFLTLKVHDPNASSVSKMMNCQPMKNVTLVLVNPQITSEFYTNTQYPDWLFRFLLPRVAKCVEKVDLTFKTPEDISIKSYTHQCLQLIQKKVREIVNRRPNDHVFLAGWGTSCLLNHKVVTEVPGVSGMLNFAFPVLSASGPRGEVDDDICLTYCPSLFVVGEYAADVELEAMQSMRRNMIVDNGLIVVGGANHNLLVSHHKLNIERVSQKCVERTIVEYAMEFMKQVMNDLGPARECREMLRPTNLPNPYEVDVAVMRCKPNPAAPGTSRPRKSQANPQTGLKQSVVKEFVC